MATEILKTLYFLYFHSILTYGIIFWGNSVCSQLIFKVQKRTIRIISNLGIRDSCRSAFKELGILPFYSQYLYSLLIFVTKNRGLFQANANFHSVNTNIRTISTCHQHIWKYFKGEFFFRELRLTITCQEG